MKPKYLLEKFREELVIEESMSKTYAELSELFEDKDKKLLFEKISEDEKEHVKITKEIISILEKYV